MSDDRQKVHLGLAMEATGQGESLIRHRQGSASPTAARNHESLAGAEQLMEEVSDRE